MQLISQKHTRLDKSKRIRLLSSDMSRRKKETEEKKIKRYGIWQEETARYGRCWRYEIRVLESDGKWHRRAASGFVTKGDAEAAVAKLKLESRQRRFGIEPPTPVKATTIGEAVDGYCKSLEEKWVGRHGARYAKRYKGQVTTIKQWAEFAGRGRAVRELTRDDFTSYVAHERQRGLKPSSIARHVNGIRAALYHAAETRPDLAGYRLPRRPSMKDADKSRMRILTDDEIKALSAALAANEEWRDVWDFFRVGLGTGARFDEILPTVEREDRAAAGIRWTDVNEHFETVLLRANKTGKDRVIHVPGVVKIIMQRKRDGRGDATHVFNCRDHWIRSVFRQASEACEILYGQQVEGGWTVHDLRHTCLTNLLQQGVDLATVRDWAGHHSITETTKYVHSTPESRARAAAASAFLVALASTKASSVDTDGATSGNSVQKRRPAKNSKIPKKKAG